MKKENGITLVALIVSIIVLLILATVSIQVLTGDNGLLTKSKTAVDKYSEGEIEEQIKLAYTEWQTAKLTGTTENVNNFIKNRLNTTIGNVEEVSVEDASVIIIINKDGGDKTYYYNLNKETIKQIILAKNSAEKNDSYVGSYADIDEDGIVDGVIFVDLLTGSIRDTQQWGDSNGVYSLPTGITTDNVRKYYISKESHTWAGITKPVLSPIGDAKERFYVMQLTDFTTPAYIDEIDSSKNYPKYTKYKWYNNAYNKMTPFVTSTTFGAGNENTRKMIDKWNTNGDAEKGGYDGATQDNQDIWKHIQTKYQEGWFLPSRAEWAAFLNELGITKENYNSIYGLQGIYWTSSQKAIAHCWRAFLSDGIMENQNVTWDRFVRLATTF